MSLHKVKVQALAFSPDDATIGQPRFLASLGGQDDNSLVLWDVATGQALCGSPTSNDFTLNLRYFARSPMHMITCGNYNLCVWEYDEVNNKLRPHPVNLGSLSRVFLSVTVDDTDTFAYVGSKTGEGRWWEIGV